MDRGHLKAIILATVITAGMESLLFYEHFWQEILAVLGFVVLLGSLWVLHFDLRQKVTRSSYTYFLIRTLLLLGSGVVFVTFLQGFAFRQGLIVILAISFFILFRAFNAFIRKGFRFAPVSRNNLSLITFFTAFLSYAIIFGGYLYFSWPGYLLMILVAFVSFLIFNQSFWQHDLFQPRRWVYILGASFLLGEVAWVMSYTPINYLAGGLVFLVVYYVLWGLTQHYFEEVLTRRLVLEHVIIAFIALALVLSTARWLPISS